MPGDQRRTTNQHDKHPHTESKTQATAQRGQEKHTRESGRWGADEPDYGRPQGKRPEPEPKSGPNRKGPQYEEGGRYPGTREVNEHTPVRSRSADPGQSSYGGFKNEDTRYQRQQKPDKKP